ncbi:MAG: hypothetical protein HY398_01125 [Candidatus Doudnabacteria bacterium]|nr:hypothetical protein [Candidatus Doudnabacteria bacterium]
MGTTNQNADEDKDGEKPAVIIPKISREEAERIIRGFNEQFEEKVLGQLAPERRAEILSTRLPENVSDYAAPGSADEAGRNLAEYLSVIKAERPDRPFADADSQFDLYAKHRTKN